MRKKVELYKGRIIIWFLDEEICEGSWIRHGFFHDKNGAPDLDRGITSVTSFIKILDKPALIPWAVKMMGIYLEKNWDIEKVKTENEKMKLIETAKKEFRRIKEEAADIGKEIHKFAEMFIKKQNPKIPEQEQIKNGITAFLNWFQNSNLRITDTEKIIYSEKYDYAGIEDWEAIKDIKLIIGDFKSSKSIYPEMRLQLALYWNAREEETGQYYEEGDIVHFDKITGKCNVLPISREEYLKDREAAIALLPIKRRLDELKY